MSNMALEALIGSTSKSAADAQADHNRAPISSDNRYRKLVAEGHSHIHAGDAYYHTGPGSHVSGPSVVHGNMTVLQNYTNDTREPPMSPLETLKRVLYYPSLDNRRAQINQIDAASLNWVWKDTKFGEWLQDDQDIFWISGKPASGKSTLMHYLVNCSKTKEMLRLSQNASPSYTDWLTIHFYFDFRAGKGVANTPSGMLRALLLQLVLASDQLAKAVLEKVDYRLQGEWINLPAELLDIIFHAVSSSDRQICGFVDGLDEYNGDFAIDLLPLLIRLQTRSKIKLCLASRPETEIVHHLRKYPSFAMQDHNQGTIQALLDEAAVDLEDPVSHGSLRELFDYVLTEAKGVILWARFAIRELVRGTQQGRTRSELDILIKKLPLELEGIYARIWQSLEDCDQMQAAAILHIVDAWGEASMDDLFVVFLQVMRKLELTSFDAQELDICSFEKRLCTLLRDFVQLSADEDYGSPLLSAKLVSLAHKTIGTFMLRSASYNACIAKMIAKSAAIESVEVHRAKCILSMADHLTPNDSAPDLEAAYEDAVEYSNTSLEQLRCASDSSCAIHKTKCLLRAVFMLLALDQEKADRPENLPLITAAASTWLYRRFGWSVLRPEKTLTPALVQHIEIVDYLSFRHVNPFAHTLDILDPVLIRPDYEALFVLALNRLLHFYPTRLYTILLLLLRRLTPQAYYMTLLAIEDDESLTDSVHEFIGRIALALNSCEVASPLMMQPSVWWNHPPTHILCCWAWSPFLFSSLSAEKQRLNALLRAGMWINECIFDGGNVLHALLTFDPLHGKDFSTEFYSSDLELQQTRHLSKIKFDTLINEGIDVSAVSELGTALDVAKRTLLQVRKMDAKAMKRSKRAAESLLATHIVPILETRMRAPTISEFG